MASGGARARSGPAPDPDSYRSQGREWFELPAGGFTGDVPDFPLPRAIQFSSYFEDGKKVTEQDDGATAAVWDAELELWADLWRKPQAHAWLTLGLKFQVAAYTRAFLESVRAEAVSGMKTAVLRMETELGISIAGMRQNGWNISTTPAAPSKPVAPAAGARQTSSGSWLSGVSVEGG